MGLYEAIVSEVSLLRNQIQGSTMVHSHEIVVYVGEVQMKVLEDVATSLAGEQHPKGDLRLNGMRVFEIDQPSHLGVGFKMSEISF